MKRRKVLQGMGTISASSAVTGIVAGDQNTYKKHDTTEKLEQIGSQISFHESQDRAAFISAAFEKGIELYIAEGVSGRSDVPAEVFQITTETAAGAYNPGREEIVSRSRKISRDIELQFRVHTGSSSTRW